MIYDPERRWTHTVRCYYAKGVRKPTRYGSTDVSGKLAIETVHRGEASARMEVRAGRSRPDIGLIEVDPPLADNGEPDVAAMIDAERFRDRDAE